MTLAQFVTELKNLPKKFKLQTRKGGQIRFQFAGRYHCPLTAVAFHKTGEKFLVSHWTGAPEALHISYRLAKRIIVAADCPTPRRMLRVEFERVLKLRARRLAA